jgi:hypothetical protein
LVGVGAQYFFGEAATAGAKVGSAENLLASGQVEGGDVQIDGGAYQVF